MKKLKWNGICQCKHKHSQHGESKSINYTAGICTVYGCKCINFCMPSNEKQKLTKEQKFELRLAYRKWAFDANPSIGESIDWWFKEIDELIK